LLPLTPAISRERAELLAKLGRTSEAIALFEALRQQSPGDRQLDIQYARLLIAAGDPGKARKVLRP
jgi:predicted Zn-dependent protease